MLPSELHTIIASYLDYFPDLYNYELSGILPVKINYLYLLKLNFDKYYHSDIINYDVRLIYSDLLMMKKAPNFIETAEYLYLNKIIDIINTYKKWNIMKYDSIKLFELFKSTHTPNTFNFNMFILNYAVNKCFRVVKYIRVNYGDELYIHAIINIIKMNRDCNVKFTDSIMFELSKYIKFESIEYNHMLIYWPSNCEKSLISVLNKAKNDYFYTGEFILLLKQIINIYNLFDSNVIRIIYDKFKSYFNQGHVLEIYNLLHDKYDKVKMNLNYKAEEISIIHDNMKYFESIIS
jgi:hypothetical protein